jgi:hypothetical protein
MGNTPSKGRQMSRRKSKAIQSAPVRMDTDMRGTGRSHSKMFKNLNIINETLPPVRERALSYNYAMVHHRDSSSEYTQRRIDEEMDELGPHTRSPHLGHRMHRGTQSHRPSLLAYSAKHVNLEDHLDPFDDNALYVDPYDEDPYLIQSQDVLSDNTTVYGTDSLRRMVNTSGISHTSEQQSALSSQNNEPNPTSLHGIDSINTLGTAGSQDSTKSYNSEANVPVDSNLSYSIPNMQALVNELICIGGRCYHGSDKVPYLLPNDPIEVER